MGEVRIGRARLYEVALPLRVPFAIAGGTMAVRRSLIVVLEDADGCAGYGEAAPFETPFYSGETVSSAIACLRELLLPRLVGASLDGLDAAHGVLSRGVRGNRMARAGAETAWWDLLARRRGRCLADLVEERLARLGVPGPSRVRRSQVECGIALGIPADRRLDVLEGEVAQAVRRGYRRVKLKVAPGWTVAPVRATMKVLAGLGAHLPVWVDANGAFDREAHEDQLERLDGCGLLFLEQPFAPAALWDSVAWSRTARTPVCLDESLTSDLAARQFVATGAPTIWNLKVQRLGGLEETCRVYARGAASGVPMWVGTMPETGLGAQAALAVAAFSACVHPTDVEPSERWYAGGSDLVELTMDPEGRMDVPTSPPAVELGEARLLADVS